MNFLNRKLKRVSIQLMAYIKIRFGTQILLLTVFPSIFLELRNVGTQISSDTYGSIDRSEYIPSFGFISMHYF